MNNINYKLKYLKYKKKYIDYKNYLFYGGVINSTPNNNNDNNDGNANNEGNEGNANNDGNDDNDNNANNEGNDDNNANNEGNYDNDNNANNEGNDDNDDDTIFDNNDNCQHIINTLSPMTIHENKNYLLYWDIQKYNSIKEYIKLCKTTYTNLIKYTEGFDIFDSNYPDIMTNIVSSIQTLICAINNGIVKEDENLLIIEPLTINMLERLCIDITENFKQIDSIIDTINKTNKNDITSDENV